MGIIAATAFALGLIATVLLAIFSPFFFIIGALLAIGVVAIFLAVYLFYLIFIELLEW